MEQYIINSEDQVEPVTIIQGKYYEKIHKKHITSYGDFGAANIRDNITSTFREALIQLNTPAKSNNMLLVGKVQSGKTSNLELFTALAFDNGFNLVIIYGGYDSTLLGQTTNRFKKTFDIPNDMDYSDDTPVVFSSSDDSAQLITIDDEIIEDLLDAHKPIFLISMKRPVAMNKVNNLLARIDKSKLKAFIIDDEGDQASLNTKKNKALDASATYASIVTMKDLLNDPLYLSVTATPQALIFLDEYSRLRPDSIRLIEPGQGYCGVDAYHLYDSGTIELINDEDQQDLSNGVLADSLKNAIRHYIIASAIMFIRGRKSSEMIIHSHRNVSAHSTIYRMVDAFIQSFKAQVEYTDTEGLETTKSEYKLALSDNFTVTIKHQQIFGDYPCTLVAINCEQYENGETIEEVIEEMHSDHSAFNGINFCINLAKELKRVSIKDIKEKHFKVKLIQFFTAEDINPFPSTPDAVSKLTYKLDLSEFDSLSESDSDLILETY